jgi:hypothetical protein
LKKLLSHIVGLPSDFQNLALRGTLTRLPQNVTLRDIEEQIRPREGSHYTFQFLVVYNGRQYQSAIAPKSNPEPEWGLERPDVTSLGFVSLNEIHPPSELEQELVNRPTQLRRAQYPIGLKPAVDSPVSASSAIEPEAPLQSSLGKTTPPM